MACRRGARYALGVSGRTPTERELKIPVTSLGVVRRRLLAAGAHRHEPLGREENTLFDTAGGTLAAAGEVLRLRRHGGLSLLTFKGRARYEGAVKNRAELETMVADPDTVGAILLRLGFVPRLRYEKDREQWRLDGVEVALDHTPMGDFVELEGAGDGPESTAANLGLEVASAVRGSYVSLWQTYRAAHPELDLPEDMVFAP